MQQKNFRVFSLDWECSATKEQINNGVVVIAKDEKEAIRKALDRYAFMPKVPDPENWMGAIEITICGYCGEEKSLCFCGGRCASEEIMLDAMERGIRKAEEID